MDGHRVVDDPALAHGRTLTGNSHWWSGGCRPIHFGSSLSRPHRWGVRARLALAIVSAPTVNNSAAHTKVDDLSVPVEGNSADFFRAAEPLLNVDVLGAVVVVGATAVVVGIPVAVGVVVVGGAGVVVVS